MKSWSLGVENQSRILLRSFGALFFASGSVSGLFFLVAIALVQPSGAMAAVVGVVAASTMGRLLGGDRVLLEAGLYGYNGALAGLGALAFVHPEATLVPGTEEMGASLALAFVAGASSGALMHAWFKSGIVDRPGLPALTLPSALSLLVFGKIAIECGLVTLSADALMPPVIDLRWHGWSGVEAAAAELAERAGSVVPVVLLLVLGYALETPRRLLPVAAALLSSYLVGSLLLGAQAVTLSSWTIYTGAPMAMSLGWFFMLPGLRSLLVVLVALPVSLVAWHQLGLFLEGHELPVTTMPFALVTFVVLAMIRLAPRALRRHLPVPVPLHRVGLTDGPRYGPGRDAGRAYWDAVKKIADAGATGVPERKIDAAVAHLAAAERVVALTGAGLSTESGIPDYRSGIIDWQVYDPDDLVYSAFLAGERARRTYWRMSQDFYGILREAKPSRGHRALADLERDGKLAGIVTQNVDRLHQRAGSSPDRVVEIHGHEFGVTCLACGAKYSRDEIHRWILHGTDVPYCVHCAGGILKPDSIAFGQPMPAAASRHALHLIDRCDLLLVAGTSLLVEPVSSLVARAAARGARLIIVNFQPTDFDAVADVVLRGPVGPILERLATAHARLRLWIDT